MPTNEPGNTAKLREALETILFTARECDAQYMANALEAIMESASAALAVPPRNCDVGTAEEQAVRFELFCNQYRVGGKVCVDCPFANNRAEQCSMRWAQMPYETTKEGGNNGSK